jgi:hypothetical protein
MICELLKTTKQCVGAACDRFHSNCSTTRWNSGYEAGDPYGRAPTEVEHRRMTDGLSNHFAIYINSLQRVVNPEATSVQRMVMEFRISSNAR